MRSAIIALGLTTLLATLMAAWARPTKLPGDPREVPREAQLNVTETRSDLDGDGVQEVVIVVNALTGDPDPARGSEVIFGVAALPVGHQHGPLHWNRHVVADTGRPAHDGEVASVDLDGDGASELILSWDRSLAADRTDRWGEIYAMSDLRRPRLIWQGLLERDSRRDEATPPAGREWLRREIDYGATRREAGQAIVFKKTQYVEGGARVDPPRVESEWVAAAVRSGGSR